MRPAAIDTTEEHRPLPDDVTSGRPMLLSAFPGLVAVAPPRGEVGRAWFADAGVRDREISSRHVRLVACGAGLSIGDVGSRNGVYVDGERVPPGELRALEDGAVVRLGKTLFVFRSHHAGSLEPAPPLGRLVGPWGLVEVRARIAQIVHNRERNVLIEGETGTGKELVAAAILHALGLSARSAAVNVASVAESTFEGQLFGWVEGAFSGSVGSSKGVLREHDGGAVFLDEIGELPPAIQAKLLRAVEYGEVLPVGARRPVKVDLTIVAATNRAVEEAVEQGRLRRDLVMRFPVRIALPRLSAHPEDLWAVLSALAARRRGELDPDKVAVEAVERMMLEPWPGNVRDLDRVLASMRPGEALTPSVVDRVLGPPRRPAAVTREGLEQALAACRGNRSAAARRLGISWGMMQRRMAEWGLGRTRT